MAAHVLLHYGSLLRQARFVPLDGVLIYTAAVTLAVMGYLYVIGRNQPVWVRLLR